MSLEQNKKVEWRSQFNKRLSSGNVYYVYYESILFNFFLYGLIAFTICLYLLWYIDIPYFRSLPSIGFDSTPIQHMGYWLTLIISQFEFPFFGRFYEWEATRYLEITGILVDNNQIGFLINRILISMLVALGFGYIGAMSHINNPIKSESKTLRRGFQVLTGKEANFGFYNDTKKDLERGAFVKFSFDTEYPISKVLTHTIGVGSTGTGKSQFLRPHVEGSIQMGLKTVILDVKYEFTGALYDPEDPTMIILDYTDKRTHVWDMSKDVTTISEIRRFANSFIPVGEGNDAMWSNSARLQFIGYYLYLLKTKKEFTPRDLADLLVNSKIEESYYIFKNFYPPALDTLGQMKNGVIEENVTSFGIKANLKAYIDGLIDLGSYISDSKYKKISLFEFMTNPDYPIKTIFIKPNENESLMSSGLIRTCLNYMISLLDSPHIGEANGALNGIFFLDEFQAPGKLTTETGSPTIDKLLDRGRSKGWGAYLFVQDMLQLENVYSESIVQQWYVVAGTKVLCGTPPGKTAEWFANMIGKAEYDKQHKNLDYKEGKATLGNFNMQTHSDEVLLPSQISSYLRPTNGNIRFLMLGVGLSNAYIFENPIVPMEQKVKHWIPNEQSNSVVNRDTDVFSLLNKQMNSLEEVPVGEDYIEEELNNNEFGEIDASIEEKRNFYIDNFDEMRKRGDLVLYIEKELIFSNVKKILPKYLSNKMCNEIVRVLNDTKEIPTERLLEAVNNVVAKDIKVYPLYRYLKDRRQTD